MLNCSYYLVCPSKDCSWFLKASSLNQSRLFKIRKYCGTRTCSVRERIYERRQGLTDVVAILVLDKFVDTKKIHTPRDIVEDMMKLHGVSLTYMQAWRSKKKAIKILRGDLTVSYDRITAYFYILDKNYPGSVLSLKKTDHDRFLYTFVALDTSLRGWEYCRPVVVIDGAHLKYSYGSTIFIASTLDLGGMSINFNNFLKYDCLCIYWVYNYVLCI